MVLRKDITSLIKDLLKKNPQGLSITDIVGSTGINRNTAGRYLENLLVSGQVEMRRFGMAKIYVLSQRVPLSAVLSISSELVLQLDNNLRIVFTNEPFLDLIGTEEKEILGKNIEYTPVTTVFEESFTMFIEHIKEGIAGKEWSGEIALTTRDIILFCRIAPTVFDDGRRGVSVILEDITQRKKAEQKVEESERQFRLLAENSLDMIGRIKPDFTHIYASPAYTTTLGYRPEEVIGKKGRLFIHPDDVHSMESVGDVLSSQHSSAVIRFRAKHKDGHYVWIESHVNAIYDEKTHGLSEYYAVSRDITERKLAEEKLQESEDRYRKLVEISPDAVIIHQQGKIIYVNPAAVRLLGEVYPNEIIGKNVLDFVQPAFRDSVRNNITKDLAGDTTPPMELQMSRVNGTPLIVEGKGVRTFIGGEFAIQVAIRDITERRQAEEVLRTKDRQLISLFSNVPEVLFYLSVEKDNCYRFLTVNQSFLDKVHLTEGQVVGKYVQEVIPEPLYSRARQKYIQAIEEKKTIEWEEVQDSPNGKRYGDCRITAVFDDRGHPTHIIGSVHDSTSHKQLEEALRESEGKLAAMLESITDIISVMDRDLNIVWANDLAKRDFGNDIIGRKCYEVYHHKKEPCDPYPCSVLRAFHDGKMHHSEIVLIDNTGETRFFEGSANVALRDTAGTPLVVLETAREITDKNKADRAFRESERRLRLVLDSTDDVIIMQDPEGRYLYFNSAARYGLSMDEMIGLTPHDFLDRETADRLVERVKTVVKTGRGIRQETPLIWKGQTLWFSDSLSPVRDSNGAITAVVTVSHNITERKRMEMALRESEATARALINAPTDSVILMDAQGIILALNETAAIRLGKRSGECVGLLADDLLPTEIAESRRSRISKVIETKEVVRFTDERKGQVYDSVVYPILNADGEVTKIAIIARDITELKNNERQLRESEQLYQRLLEQSFDAIAIHKDKKIVYVNRRAAEILGAASPEELIDRQIFDLIHPDSRVDLENRLRNLSSVQGKPVPVMTEKFFRVDGTIVTVKVMAISFDDNGTPAIKVAFREIVPPADRSCGSDRKR